MADRMSQSFRLNPPPLPEPAENRAVAVTGAVGLIGRSFAEYAQSRYTLTRLVHSKGSAQSVSSFGRTVVADLSETDRLKELFQGIDTVVHLAADPSPDAGWESLRKNNSQGTYSTFLSAAAAGCRRVGWQRPPFTWFPVIRPAIRCIRTIRSIPAICTGCPNVLQKHSAG